MATKEELLEIVIACTRRVIEENNIGDVASIVHNTPLYGKNGILDSLGLVQLIADAEDEIYNKYNKTITIADEKAMSMKFSPFRSIASLTDYIESLLTGQNEKQ